jgi:hypothetical protein
VYERSSGKIELLTRYGQKFEPGQYNSHACYASDHFGEGKD